MIVIGLVGVKSLLDLTVLSRFISFMHYVPPQLILSYLRGNEIDTNLHYPIPWLGGTRVDIFKQTIQRLLFMDDMSRVIKKFDYQMEIVKNITNTKDLEKR